MGLVPQRACGPPRGLFIHVGMHFESSEALPLGSVGSALTPRVGTSCKKGPVPLLQEGSTPACMALDGVVISPYYTQRALHFDVNGDLAGEGLEQKTSTTDIFLVMCFFFPSHFQLWNYLNAPIFQLARIIGFARILSSKPTPGWLSSVSGTSSPDTFRYFCLEGLLLPKPHGVYIFDCHYLKYGIKDDKAHKATDRN